MSSFFIWPAGWIRRRGSKDYKNLRRRNTWIFMVRRSTYWTRSYTRWIWKCLFNQWICKRSSHSDRRISNCCVYNRKLQVNDKFHIRDGIIRLLLDYSFVPSILVELKVSFFFNFLAMVCSKSQLFRLKSVTAFARQMIIRFGWLWLVRSSVF